MEVTYDSHECQNKTTIKTWKCSNSIFLSLKYLKQIVIKNEFTLRCHNQHYVDPNTLQLNATVLVAKFKSPSKTPKTHSIKFLSTKINVI
jgi:hypothetical protein